MNALIPSAIEGEIIEPSATVRAIGRTNPLSGRRIDCVVRAGSTVFEILHEALASRPGSVLSRDFIVHIDGDVIPESMWSRVRLKPGTTLTFTPVLAGGNALRAVLSIVIVITAIILAAPTGGASLAVASALSVTAATASALVSAGIILAGTLALNALLPIAPTGSNNVNTTALNSIQGASNQLNPFGSIPVVLGRHRQSPYFAAKPYTEILGDDQYLRLVFCLGYGPLAIDTPQIGETAFSSFTDTAIEIRQGVPGDPPLTLYPGTVNELSLTVVLDDSLWHSQTTAINTDEISVDVIAPNGMYHVDSHGNISDWSVTVEMQYRLVGTNPWTTFGPIVFTKSTQPQRSGVRVVVPRGQYQVQVSAAGGGKGGDPNTKENTVWTALRSFNNTYPLNFNKPLALIAMRIKATGQLSGVIDTFNCICTSQVNAFNGTTWVATTASQNPADLFRHVLQGPANARPRSDAQIDVANLQAWWTYCTANGFQFNQVVNSVGSVYSKLCDIAAAGRAVPTFTNGLWGVDWDRPNDSIVQHFTPRNSWGFQLSHPYVQQPHGWRASFINEDNGFTQDERIVYDDGYNSSNATLFEGIQFPGVTDAGLIWKHGRFHIAQSRLRPEKVTINVGWEHLVCTRGDRVRLTHDAILIGLAPGRVKSVVGQVVTVDELLTIVSGKTYGLQFRVPDDVRSFERAIDPNTIAGQYTSLTLIGDLSLVSPGALFSFGETGQETAVYRVQGISHQKDLIATLTLVDDAPAISQADQGVIPPYNPNITVPPDPLSLAPQDFRYLPAVDGIGNSVRAITRLSWVIVRHGKIVASELQFASGSGGDWQPLAVLPWPQFSLDVPLPSPGIWSYRVRFQFSDNTVSSWVTLANLTLLGLSGAPPDVQNIRAVAYVDNNTSIAWDEVTDYRPIRYAVRKGDSWDSGLELGTIAHPPFAAHGDGSYLVKAYAGPDTQRAYSVNAAEVTIAGSSLVANVIATRDEGANGWLGVFTGAVGKAGTIIRTGGAGNLLADADYLHTADILNFGGQGNGTYEIDPSRYIDAGRVAPCRVTITWKGSSVAVNDNYLGNPNILTNPDVLAAGSTNLVSVYPDISLEQNAFTGDVFALDPSRNPLNDLFAELDIFSAGDSFGSWFKYEPGVYIARKFRSRLNLTTSDDQVEAVALQYVFSVDVPDRLDTWGLIGGVGTSLNQITVPSGGLVVTFASNGKTIGEPFNGGPGTDAVPLVQITNTSASAFDFEVNPISLTSCTIIPRLAGTPTNAPKTNISIQGW